jgi:hypothetical protein
LETDDDFVMYAHIQYTLPEELLLCSTGVHLNKHAFEEACRVGRGFLKGKKIYQLSIMPAYIHGHEHATGYFVPKL